MTDERTEARLASIEEQLHDVLELLAACVGPPREVEPTIPGLEEQHREFVSRIRAADGRRA
jgi:hypothetical protein